MYRTLLFIFIFFAITSSPHKSWRAYRGDVGINAYSQLIQINKENVKQLQVALTYRTCDHTKSSIKK